VRVLIAEDDPVSRSLLGKVLATWGHDVVVTRDGAEAWEVLRADGAPRLAILDWMMPGMDGPEVCRRVRELDLQSPPYLILLTARDAKSDLVAGLEAGADDYVGKPFDREVLRVRIEVGRRFTLLNERLLETQRELARQVLTDTLTGAMNRRAVLDRLSQELARSRRDGTTIGVGMIDVDHFKRVNDSMGHASGDAALREVVRRCVDSLRPYDLFGRMGGEEFLIVIPNARYADLRGVLERMREAVSASPFDLDGARVPVTVSVGGTINGGETSLDAIIRRADAALYQAKREGRDRVVMAPVLERTRTAGRPLLLPAAPAAPGTASA
jgi:two-component system, cell cycle response regulator